MSNVLDALAIGAQSRPIIVGSLLIFGYCVAKTLLFAYRHPTAPTRLTLVLDVVIGIGTFAILSLVYGLILGVA